MQVPSPDVALGLVLCVTVAAASVIPPRPPQLLPAGWSGVTVQDLLFPVFLSLSGVALALTTRGGGRGRALGLGVTLLLCGLAFNAVVAGSLDLSALRWSGALQVYAVVVVVVGLLQPVLRGARGWALVTGVAAVGQAAFLIVWQSGCPGDALTRACNPSRVVDQALLGASHMYAGGTLGHDPEGVVALLGALVTALAGVTAGHVVIAARGSRRAPAYLLGWAAALALLAVASSGLLPATRRLWTTPFALGTASLAVVLLALVTVVLGLPVPDRLRSLRERVAWPLVAMGRNGVPVYFGSELVMLVLLTRRDADAHPWANVLGDRVEDLALGHNRTGIVALMLGLWLCVAALLHWRRVHLRV